MRKISDEIEIDASVKKQQVKRQEMQSASDTSAGDNMRFNSGRSFVRFSSQPLAPCNRWPTRSNCMPISRHIVPKIRNIVEVFEEAENEKLADLTRSISAKSEEGLASAGLAIPVVRL